MVFGADTVELASWPMPSSAGPTAAFARAHAQTSTLLRVDLGIAASTRNCSRLERESNGVAVGFWGNPFWRRCRGTSLAIGLRRGRTGLRSGKCSALVRITKRLTPSAVAGGPVVPSRTSLQRPEPGWPLEARHHRARRERGVMHQFLHHRFGEPGRHLALPGRGYIFGSWGGTSMGSPVSAGVAALLLEAFPWTNRRNCVRRRTERAH